MLFTTEQDVEIQLGYYDYGFRYYDPAIGRWGQVDPLAEIYESWTPYNYVGNNPISHIDPDGRFRTRFGAWFYKVTHKDAFAVTEQDDGSYTVATYGGLVAKWQGGSSQGSSSVAFAYGFSNAMSSNMGVGPRIDGRNNSAFNAGQSAGDIASIIQGTGEMIAGATIATGGAAGGIVTSPTGVGAIAGAGVTAGGIAISTHGGVTTLNGISHLFAKGKGNGSSGGNYKRLSSNKAANEYAQKLGYKDAHDLKNSYVPGKVSQFDIYRDSSTGAGKLIKKSDSSVQIHID